MNSTLKIISRLTALDEEYKTCSFTYAELRIYPASQSAEEITNILGINPSKAQNEWMSIRNSKGRIRKIPRTGWFLSSEGIVNSKDLRAHLDWLIHQLIDAKPALLSLQETEGMKMNVTCIWWSAFGHGGPVLWPEQMKALTELNLECSFDLYFSD